MIFPPKPGQIVTALISDPDGKRFKIRPVLVIETSEDDQGEFVNVVAITTKFRKPVPSDEILLIPDGSNNLTEESVIQLNWVSNVDLKHIREVMGRVDAKTFTKVSEYYNLD